MSALPEPLVPSEVDLRGLEYMPLLGARLFESDFNLDANDAEFRVGLRLWWSAWNQVPAGSLPTDERRLCKLAGLDDNLTKWRKLRARAMHGFIECSDGRLYHPIVAKQALIAWDKRAESTAERQNEAERQRRSRAERKRMFDELRAVGVTLKWDIHMSELRDLHSKHVTPNVTPVTVTGHATDTVTDTAKTGRDVTGIEKTRERPRTGDSTDGGAGPSDSEPLAFVPTPAGRACIAMRQAGIADTNPGHPDLLALIGAGATPEEFAGAAVEAVRRGSGFAYALAILTRQRTEAAQKAKGLHHGPMPKADDRKSRQLTTAALMTGQSRQKSQSQPEIIDADDARFLAP